VLVQSAAIESSSNHQITQMMMSRDQLHLLLAVNSRRIGLQHQCLNLAEILARAGFGQICQNWPDGRPTRFGAKI